jgi:23S rRNA U2552 (ribose-2'-O)-methylase RlmE/FtsJ
MIIVKSVQFRENLKELLEKAYNGEEEDLFIDYYGKLFKIVPVSKKQVQKTQSQKVLEHFKNRKRHIFADNSIFNEADTAQEKENFRNLKYGNND